MKRVRFNTGVELNLGKGLKLNTGVELSGFNSEKIVRTRNKKLAPLKQVKFDTGVELFGTNSRAGFMHEISAAQPSVRKELTFQTDFSLD